MVARVVPDPARVTEKPPLSAKAPKRKRSSTVSAATTKLGPAIEDIKQSLSASSLIVHAILPTANLSKPVQEADLVNESANDGRCRSWGGSIASAFFVTFATCLAISTYSLGTLANKSVNLGTIETAFDHDVWDVPVMTWLNHTTSVAAGANQTITSASYGSQSLGDLQYDKCGKRDWECADKVRPNTEHVYSLVASTFPTIANFDLPELVEASERMQMQYVSQLTGFNFPVVQYFVRGIDWAIVCTVRRGTYQLGTVAVSEIDSVAMCIKRRYDPDWGCENDSKMDASVYVIKVLHGRATYIGQTKRREVYYNPGNVATLTGSVHGTGLLSTVSSNDEYQGGVLVAKAPWDGYLWHIPL